MMKILIFYFLSTFTTLREKKAEETFSFHYFLLIRGKGTFSLASLMYSTLREKCPNTKLFMVRIFLYLD